MSAYREPASEPERVAPVRRWMPDPFAIAVAVVVAAAGVAASVDLVDRPVQCEASPFGSDRLILYVCHPARE